MSAIIESPPMTKAEKGTHFEKKVVKHGALTAALSRLLNTIKMPSGGSLVILHGPTGVGKTTLSQRTVRQLVDDYKDQMENNPGLIPVIHLETACPDSGIFSWRDLYIRSLEKLQEPHIDKKLPRQLAKGDRQFEVGGQSKGISGPDLRRALEQALHYRGTRVVIFDEAQHFAKSASGKKLHDQMDTIKSLANLGNVLIVLVGTYDLLAFLEFNAQLARRTRLIHFPRYRWELADDRHDFKLLIRTLQDALPLSRPSDLISHSEYLYEYSVGCVGNLKGWLNRALALALERDDPVVTLSHLKETTTPKHALKKMAEEIRESEYKWKQYEDTPYDLKTILGPPSQETSQDIEKKAKQSGNCSPGQRSPTRDKVGG